MERFTHYDADGRVYSSRGYEIALSRLAAYEDTGLSPDEITSSQTEWNANRSAPNNYVATVPVRCKDCRFLGGENLGLHDCDHYRGPMRVKLDDFCSYGEPKEARHV